MLGRAAAAAAVVSAAAAARCSSVADRCARVNKAPLVADRSSWVVLPAAGVVLRANTSANSWTVSKVRGEHQTRETTEKIER